MAYIATNQLSVLVAGVERWPLSQRRRRLECAHAPTRSRGRGAWSEGELRQLRRRRRECWRQSTSETPIILSDQTLKQHYRGISWKA